MKHEPQKFGSAETFFFVIYAKLFLYTISDSESQTPLLQFFWRGGGGGGVSVHRLVKLGKHIQTDLH